MLSHPSHPGNIGAAARAMKTMGLTSLYLVRPKHFPDQQASARSAGATDVLQSARVCNTLDEALRGTALAVAMTGRRRDLAPAVVSARQAAPRILEAALGEQVAVVFGTEMSGLTNAEVGKCQLLATVPANPRYPSLNLAAAVQVMAYELRQQWSASPPSPAKPREPAAFEDVERFHQHLEQVLMDIGFLDPHHPKRLMQRLRRMFSRSGLEKEEVNILRGILSAVQNSGLQD